MSLKQEPHGASMKAAGSEIGNWLSPNGYCNEEGYVC